MLVPLKHLPKCVALWDSNLSKLKRLFFYILCSCIANFAFAQRATISGVVKDMETGEILIGASVFDKISGQGTVTNYQGFYTLSLEKNKNIDLSFSFIGYQEESHAFTLTADTSLYVMLVPSLELDELVVEADIYDNSVKGSQMSTINIGSAQIKNVPTLFGEADLLKALQMMPGVQSGGDGSTGMYIRGGGPDENLVLLDGVPLYNVSHLLGFFSVFNTDAIKNVTLYKGSFPARFGSRLSSVIDVRTNSGNDKEYHGNVSIGLISAKLNIEGPIVKEKTTFNISARRSYLDLISRPILRARSRKRGDDTSADFICYLYDVNAKIEHRFNDRHRLSGNFYMGHDNLGFGYKANTQTNNMSGDQTINFKFGWGNILGALQYTGILTNKFFFNSTLSYTNYDNKIGISAITKVQEDSLSAPIKQKADLYFRTQINDLNANFNFEYTPIQQHQIKFGGNYIWHTFVQKYECEQNMISNDEMPIEIPAFEDNTIGHEVSLYIEDNFSIGHFFKANAGLRYSTFFVNETNYHSLEPRLSTRFLITSDLSIKASYSRMSQYILMLTSNNMSFPTDLWVPVTDSIKPMKSNQVSLGVYYDLKKTYNFSVEGYCKLMKNAIEYKDGESLFAIDNSRIKEAILNGTLDQFLQWEDKVTTGKGYSYGVEFLAQKTKGKFTGLIGYTLSWSKRKFDEINNGDYFYARYDGRHNINISASYKINKIIDLSAAWIFSSGNAVTLSTQVYNTPEDFIDEKNQMATPTVKYVSSRNNYRLPNYHRLDIGANFTWEKKRFSHILNVSVYNVYCHYNPYLVYTSYEVETQKSKLMQLSILPIIPSVSYTFKF